MARLTPVKAIRAKCMDCCCNQQAEVRNCENEDCPLHPYRMGKRPKKTNPDECAEEILEEDTEE